jgi:hypothetical protein
MVKNYSLHMRQGGMYQKMVIVALSWMYTEKPKSYQSVFPKRENGGRFTLALFW